MSEHPITPAAPPSVPRKHLITASRLLAALALATALGVWLYTTREIHALEAELARKLSAIETRSNESRVLASQAQESMRELLVKIGVLEQKLQESRDQQLALETLYQELARGRDEATLAEIEQLVYFASQQLQLSGNVKAALIALQNAESHLSRSDKPQFHRLRQVIARDVERLRTSPSVDVAGLSLRLSELTDTVDELPLFPAQPALASGKPSATAASSPSGLAWWKRFAAEVWSDLTQLVRIQDTGRAELPLLPPEQAYYARENLKLRLLMARLALAQHDEASYRRDLKAAQTWLARYFDTDDKRVKAAAGLLRQLAESPVRVDLPDISASVAAVRDFRLAAERGTR
ncbi:uroporphyrinogen-III C-methyltransferase [Thiobacter aerophilum]|uniref:Uroporphyrinogen-III C-methyltransferase n=1 Tax=Thiobacter aerophilum TaxID=3121275 RepID=A0ABV0EGW4_9BURK